MDADAAIAAGEPPPSHRQPLDRERIVEGALAYIEEHGVASLTMRRLGGALGVEAMALYRYVPSKEELLDAVVDLLLTSMQRDERVLDEPRDGWQDFLQRLAHGVRTVAIKYPQAFPLIASRPPEAPWLRPPLRSLEWVESFLNGLTGEGFGDEEAVAAYRAFSSFLLGHLLLEVAVRGADVGPLDTLDPPHPEEPGLGEFPTVERLRDGLSEDHSAAEFEEALEQLLDRMGAIKRHASA